MRRYLSTPNSAFPRNHALLKIDAVSGIVQFARYFNGELTNVVVDEHDNVFFANYPQQMGGVYEAPELRSVDSAGVDRWLVSPAVPSSVTPVSVFNGQVVLTEGRVVSTIDGSTLSPALPLGTMRNALMSSTGRTLLLPPTLTKPIILPPRTVRAIWVPSQSVVPAWDQLVAETDNQIWFGLVSDLAASASGDVLVAGAIGPSSTLLTALTSSGTTRFACEVANAPPDVTLRFDSAVALLDGRWAVVEHYECRVCDGGDSNRLRVFAVPGERPATHGWVGSFGGPFGDSRPAP